MHLGNGGVNQWFQTVALTVNAEFSVSAQM